MTSTTRPHADIGHGIGDRLRPCLALACLRLIALPNPHALLAKIGAYAAGLGLVLDVALEIEAIPDIPLLVQAAGRK